jgi:Uncharacterized conserved protein
MPEQVRCEVKGVFVVMNNAATVPAVILADGAGRQLPIFVGLWEAVSINSAQNGEVLPRPQAHDLFLSALERYGIAVQGLRIDSLEDSVYYAQLDLSREGKDESLDCRPSDGIAVALRAHAPITVAETVLAAAETGDTVADMVDLSTFLCS